jgi:hypothetical protein
MTHSARLAEMQRLDPERDAARIVHLMACYEFPWDMTRSLEIALFRTFCAPAVSSLLDRTSEFGARAQRRYDDTDILISALLESGYDGEPGRKALRRINYQHGRFEIANEEFLYVLSTFVFEPIRWNRLFGWRSMSDSERLGLFHFWRAAGERMGIRDIPGDYDAFERFSRAYEAAHFRYADSNRRVGEAVLDMFCGWFPFAPKSWVRNAILSLMDDAALEAFGFARPPRFLRDCVHRALRLRAFLLKRLPKRRRPRLRTLDKHRSYPDGHVIEKLGPPGV